MSIRCGSRAVRPRTALSIGLLTLPGFFRPTKEWDLLAVVDRTLVAAIEFKALGGPSFGNNCNNRAEEALGNAQDLWTAFREGKFGTRHRPWLGYVYLVEDAEKSRSPVSVKEPHFEVFPEFKGASYQRRCQMMCERLVLERMYDAACLIVANRIGGMQGKFKQPAPDLAFEHFATALQSHAARVCADLGRR